MPLDVGEHWLELPLPVDYVSEYVARLLSEWGQTVTLKSDDYSNGQSAVIGSGIRRMNPALVTVWVTSSPVGSALVHVRAQAKEGVVAQRGGQQVAGEVACALRGLDTSAAGV